MKLETILKCKETQYTTQGIEISKVIFLKQNKYDFFKSHLQKDFDFIMENQNQMGYQENQRYGLLITTDNMEEGILVDSQGYNYARYTAHVPCVKYYADEYLNKISHEIIEGKESFNQTCEKYQIEDEDIKSLIKTKCELILKSVDENFVQEIIR